MILRINIGKMSKKKTIVVFTAIVIGILLLIGGGFFYVDSLVYKSARVEAGVTVKAADFMKKPAEEAKFVDKEGHEIVPDISALGEHILYVKSGRWTHKVRLTVVDTLAPKAEAVAVAADMDFEPLPSAFVTNIEDATAVSLAFMEEPDMTQAGEQRVKVVLTDLGGNQTYVESTLTLTPVRRELSREIGSEVPRLSDFVIYGQQYDTWFSFDKVKMDKIEDWEFSIQVDGRYYDTVLHVVDTTPPLVEVTDLEWYIDVPVSPEFFVESIEDATKVTAYFVEEPPVDTEGLQRVSLCFTDEAGNETRKEATMNLGKDTLPPEILGAADLVVYLGRGVSYRKDITLQDNCMVGLTLEVDSSNVDLTQTGTYPVTYIARDYTGNETRVSVNLTVAERCYDPEAVNEKADEVLAKILKEGMTNQEKVRAIYNYVRSHVGYISHSEKDSWVRGAYEGLYDGKGDCFVFASTTKVLLDRAGIKNMDIEKIPSKTSHYWNLVDLEDGHGWYHLDTTPRNDHVVIFLWDEATLMDYSAKHYKSHNYDHELYPEVP